MKTAVIALTAQGTRLAAGISSSLGADVFVKEDLQGLLPGNVSQEQRHPFTDFGKMMEQAFLHYEALVCIMACGIVVRSLAPYLQGKDKDPAVVVVDEKGQFIISLLSGHIGGANDLARVVAALTGGTPVITTATDVQGLPAFDELAVKNHCTIENLQMMKWVSGALLQGETIYFYTDVPIEGTLPENIMSEALEKFEALKGQPETAVLLTNAAKIPYLGEEGGWGKTLVLRPRNLVLGIGCKKGKSLAEIREAVQDFLLQQGKSPWSLRCMASINLKAQEPGLLAFAAEKQLPFHTYSPQEIGVIEDQFSSSDFVRQTTGVGSVAEACAALAGKPGKMIAGKTVYKGITLALWEEETVFHTKFPLDPAEETSMSEPLDKSPEKEGCPMSTIKVIGIGPGNLEEMTPRARTAMEEADLIVGYNTYIDLVEEHFPGKRFLRSGMTREVERCRLVLEKAEEGNKVALISSGDSGIYGMAGIMLEVANQAQSRIPVEIIPGITAAGAAAAVLGAPLMHDFAVISLSDLLTPLDLIYHRVEQAAMGDFILCLYNPKSKKRTQAIEKVQEILLKHQKGDTPVGIVRNACRENESSCITDLKGMLKADIDMFSVVIIGNSSTYVEGGKIITPRGYHL